MADIKYYDVILKPVITEKSMAGMGDKKYTFLVHPDATKNQIKEAVEKMFEGTKVKSVSAEVLVNGGFNRLFQFTVAVINVAADGIRSIRS